jgi:hypothetical protein
MTTQKFIAGALFAATALAAAATAQAATILGSSTGGTSPNVFYTSGGTVTASDTNAQYRDRVAGTTANGVSFSLTGGTPGTYDSTTETLNFTGGGSFSYGTLLSGTFGAATLHLQSVDPTLGGSFQFVSNNVTFTGGSDQHGFTSGAISLEALNAFDLSGGTNLVNGTTGFNSFTATDGVTINGVSPSATPEPGTVASFGIGGIGLLGLMLRARKARKSVA